MVHPGGEPMLLSFLILVPLLQNHLGIWAFSSIIASAESIIWREK